ncbi:hypothetical protein D9M73_151470 [compost metagenome]
MTPVDHAKNLWIHGTKRRRAAQGRPPARGGSLEAVAHTELDAPRQGQRIVADQAGKQRVGNLPRVWINRVVYKAVKVFEVLVVEGVQHIDCDADLILAEATEVDMLFEAEIDFAEREQPLDAVLDRIG